jgi:hypothetical protein
MTSHSGQPSYLVESLRHWMVYLGRTAVLAAVILLWTVAANAACPTFPPTPGGPIEKQWNALGGCTGSLGDSIGPERRNPFTGGLAQDFTHGQIVIFDRWASGSAGQMPQFVMAAVVAGSKVHVVWGDTAPFSYNFFNVRWDFDGLDDEIQKQHQGGAQQQSTPGGKKGSADFTVNASGILRIAVEGCDKGFFSSTCKQGFSHPVTVDVPPELVMNIPSPPPPTSAATPTQPATTTRLFDNISDGVQPDPMSSDLVAAANCDASKILDTTGDHAGEVGTTPTIALLRKVRNIAIPCRNLPDPTFQSDAMKLRAWINQKIRDAKVVSQPGTDAAFAQGLVGGALGITIAVLIATVLGLFAGPLIGKIAALIGIAVGAVVGFINCHTPGDYDMRLVGLVQISYQFDDLLDQSTKDHILHNLLTVSGPASERREFLWLCGIPSFVPESENHILMTESSRYLTNQRIASDSARRGVPVPADNDNEANGMNDWFLGHLQGFLQNDFYEYNARPYTFEARNGIQNLHDYAAFPGGACWRSNPGDPGVPPVPRACDVKRGARIVLDYLAAKFAISSNGLRRVAPFRRQPERRTYPFLFGRASDDEQTSYLAYANGSMNFWTQRYGMPPGADMQAAYLGEFRPSPVITDIMSDAAPTQESYERFFFSRGSHYAMEIYYRNANYMISAGGIHDSGRLSFFGNAEDAWAMPTTLMPARAGLDRREFVSILGSDDEGVRVNTCVSPSFACGQNPSVPPGVPAACQLKSGDWTFLDFEAFSPGCDIDYGFFVVVYSRACAHTTCDGRFGFFEVTPWRTGLADLAKKIQATNPDSFKEDTQNQYIGANGRDYFFTPAPHADTFSPNTGLLWENWAMDGFEDPKGPLVKFDTVVHHWPLADGTLVHSDDHKGCVIVENPRMQQRLVLDYTDKNHPTRTRVWTVGGGQECGCPLPQRCLPPRFQ